MDCWPETNMRVIFAGRDNNFNRRYVTELFRDHEIVACLFLEIDRFSYAARWRKITRRMKRYGVLRVIDELAFHVYDRVANGKHSKQMLASDPDFFLKSTKLPCPAFQVSNIHNKKWLSYIQEQEPDLIFSICCNVIFRPKLYSIPKYGTFVLHEGLTPEYKGLHTPIWALLNNEEEFIGYTVLRVNDEIDGGEVLVQDTYKLAPGEDIRTWSWIGHNALIQGLPKIRDSLAELEKNGSFTPISLEGRKNQYYSWVTLSEYLRRRRRS